MTRHLSVWFPRVCGQEGAIRKGPQKIVGGAWAISSGRAQRGLKMQRFHRDLEDRKL